MWLFLLPSCMIMWEPQNQTWWGEVGRLLSLELGRRHSFAHVCVLFCAMLSPPEALVYPKSSLRPSLLRDLSYIVCSFLKNAWYIASSSRSLSTGTTIDFNLFFGFIGEYLMILPGLSTHNSAWLHTEVDFSFFWDVDWKCWAVDLDVWGYPLLYIC